MRRGACLLALLGMTVQSAVGADNPAAGTTRLPASGTTQVAGKGTPGTPQKFSRSTETPPANDELKNYYKELFGEDPPSSLSPAGQSPLSPRGTVTQASGTARPAATPSVTPTTVTADTKEIIHADFKGQRESTGAIEQIGGERFSARPFPGAAVNATRTAQTEEATAPVTPSQTALSPASSLPSSGKGTVTFSRGGSFNATPAARPSSQPEAAPPVNRQTAARRSEPLGATSIATAAPSVKVEWQKQTDINIGQECSCQLLVSNVGQSTAREVEVRALFPASVRLVAAQPSPDQAEKFLGWSFSELKPGETKTIEITMIPLERGDINTRADVRFSGSAEGLFAVSEPLLNISVEGPQQVLVGEPASHLVTISNPGTGIANGVQIEAILTEGLEHARGQRLLMELGNLNPGESRSVRLALAATKGGRQQVEVQAKSETGLVRSAESTVEVIAPKLSTVIQGPGLRYVGRQGVYTLVVTNDGAAATDNVQVRYKVPDGFEFAAADRGAQYDPATGLLTWFVGRLEPGQKSEIRATLIARQLGEFKHLARATSEHGTISDTECSTRVEGTSSLALSVKDLEDPVEVGSQTSYEIRIRNEGSAAARAVGLTCELPPGMTFVNAEGPSDFMCEGGTVLFRALPELAAGQTVTFKVNVSAGAAGSLRFRALLSSESIAEPLAAEELTKFYGER